MSIRWLLSFTKVKIYSRALEMRAFPGFRWIVKASWRVGRLPYFGIHGCYHCYRIKCVLGHRDAFCLCVPLENALGHEKLHTRNNFLIRMQPWHRQNNSLLIAGQKKKFDISRTMCGLHCTSSQPEMVSLVATGQDALFGESLWNKFLWPEHRRQEFSLPLRP